MKNLGRQAAGFGLACALAIGFSPLAFADDGTTTPPGATPLATQAPSPTPTAGATPTPSAPQISPTATPTAPSASPSPSTPGVRAADAGWTYVVSANGACGGAGADKTVVYNASTGVMTVDLNVLAADTTENYTEYRIDSLATAPCVADVTKLEFTGSDPRLESVYIGSSAFKQVNATGTNSLSSVEFPAGITSLWIMTDAFRQDCGQGNNTLATVTLPTGLTYIGISSGAFAQYARSASGDNALQEITIPATVTNLAINDDAFWQRSLHGSNTLSTVQILGADAYLSIGNRAFMQEAYAGHNALASVTFPQATTSLSIGQSAFQQWANEDTALHTIAFASTLTELNVGPSAFAQVSSTGSLALETVTFPAATAAMSLGQSSFLQGSSYGNTALASVTFPKSMSYLSIDSQAFFQQADGNCTLKTINFPQSTSMGTFIGEAAFSQFANGAAALSAVVFPAQTDTLVISIHAFTQTSAANALTRVTFPSSVKTLYVDTEAFSETISASVLNQLIFPFSTPPSDGSWFGADIVGTATGVSWLWFGPDNANLKNWKLITRSPTQLKNLAAVHPASPASNPDQALIGYHTLQLTNITGGTATRYVYRDGQSLTSPLSGQTSTVGPARNGGFPISLSRASQPGKTFLGWCTKATTGSSTCSGTLLKAGTTQNLSANTTLWAVWQASTSSSNEDIAYTGASGFAPILAIALGLLAAGLAMVLQRRRA